MFREHPETQMISEWLEQPEVYKHLQPLVIDWNQLELLGIDLADQIEKLVRDKRSEFPLDVDLLVVDWNSLAEHYALAICQVDEDELIRRRQHYERLSCD